MKERWRDSTAILTSMVASAILLVYAQYKRRHTHTLFIKPPRPKSDRKRERAGCVALRILDGRLQILLISSRKHPEYWTFPAGGMEPGEQQQTSALRETLEEAGVDGTLAQHICDFDDGKSLTHMYALKVTAELDEWEERGQRRRRWFDLGIPRSAESAKLLAQAAAAISPKEVHQYILHAVAGLHMDLCKLESST